jgi:hypothetical protein
LLCGLKHRDADFRLTAASSARGLERVGESGGATGRRGARSPAPSLSRQKWLGPCQCFRDRVSSRKEWREEVDFGGRSSGPRGNLLKAAATFLPPWQGKGLTHRLFRWPIFRAALVGDAGECSGDCIYRQHLSRRHSLPSPVEGFDQQATKNIRPLHRLCASALSAPCA